MAAEVGSGEAAPTKPAAVISANGNGQGRRAPATRRPNRRVMVLIGLGVASRLLRDPRFQAQVITAAVGLAVLKSAAQKSLTQNSKGLGAYFEGNRLRLEAKALRLEAKAEAKALRLEAKAKKALA